MKKRAGMYKSEKRKKELQKQKKQEMKRQKRLDKEQHSAERDEGETPVAPEEPAEAQ